MTWSNKLQQNHINVLATGDMMANQFHFHDLNWQKHGGEAKSNWNHTTHFSACWLVYAGVYQSAGMPRSY